MYKISKDGLEQIRIIKNALDAMYDKLDQDVDIPLTKAPKNVDGSYQKVKVFDGVQQEFEAIAGIVDLAGSWEEVQ